MLPLGGGRGRRRVTGYTIAVTSGDAQTATVGQAVGSALTATVKARGTGTVVSGATVYWTASGDGTVTASSQTNGSGVASATWTLGTLSGAQSVTATVAGGGSVQFTATGTADAAAEVRANSTTDQSKGTSTAVDTPPSVLVVDQYGNPKSGVAVTWAVASGGGSLNTTGGTSTGSDGVATVTSWTLGASVGANSVTATCAGLTGSPVTFNANATAAVATQIVVQSGGDQTGIVVGTSSATITFRVKDAGGTAVAGVTVGFVASGGILSASSDISDVSGDVQVSLTTSGLVATYTITAGFNDFAVSVDTTVTSTAGAAFALAMVTQPSSNGTSGVALSQQPIVEVVDQYGNRNTSATNTVTASVLTGNAAITAGSAKAAVSGLATFSGLTMTDSDGGANILRFSASGLSTVDSSGVTLAPPIPTKLGVGTGPSTVNVDATISPAPTFLVQDSGGVTVPGATNAVTVALGDNGEGATLNGTLTVNAVDGVATFNGLSVDTAGGYTLDATASGLTGVSSSAFTVNAASGNYPNLPGGYSLFSRALCDIAPSTSWGTVSGWTGSHQCDSAGVVTIQSDATAPLTPPGVWRTRFGTGQQQGVGPVSYDSWVGSESSPTEYSEIYFSWRFKIGTTSGFWNHPVGTKLGFLAYAEAFNTSRNQLFLLMKGTGSAPGAMQTSAQLQVIQQRNLDATRTCSGGNILTTGVWHHLEMVLKINSGAGNADGEMHLWLDNTKRLTVTNAIYRTSGNTKKFYWYRWNPTWGGVTTGASHSGHTDDIWTDDYALYGVI